MFNWYELCYPNYGATQYTNPYPYILIKKKNLESLNYNIYIVDFIYKALLYKSV